MSVLPFTGIRAVDFGWAMAGPVTSKYLAMFGADVLKIESRKRPDGTRGASVDKSTYFANHNVSKRSVAIDMSTEEGRQVALDLIATADLVMENFAPGQMARWGLDYTSLASRWPRIICVSSSVMGQTGSKARHPGFGSLLQAFAGINFVTGWPDRDPIGPMEPYPDLIAPWYALLAIVAALEQRERTGRGCAIDVSQLEATLQFMTPALVDYQVNRRLPERRGNRSETQAPHGAFPTRREDEWVAIAVLDDEMWARLVAATQIDLLATPSLATAPERLKRVDEIEAALAAWTRVRDGWEIERTLQAAGVAAAVVEDGSHLHADQQLAARRHFILVDHPAIGPHPVDGPSFRMSEIEPRLEPAPLLGQHTATVLQALPGYDEERVRRLMERGVLA